MSEVRMCDRCGRVFSVNEDFETYSGTRKVKDANGRTKVENASGDACSYCITAPVQSPRLALDAMPVLADSGDKA